MRNVLLLVVVCLSFFANSQLLWRDFSHPILASLTNDRQATVEYGDAGEIYFIYYDASISTVKVDRLNPETLAWINIYFKNVSCCVGNTAKDFVSKKIGSNIYFSYVLDDLTVGYMNLVMIEANGSTTDLVAIGVTNNNYSTLYDFHVDIASFTAYFAYDKAGGIEVDQFDLNPSAPVNTPSLSSGVILVDGSLPKLVQDISEDELYLAVIDNGLNNYSIYKAPFTNLLNFSYQGGIGNIALSGTGNGTYLSLAEKLDNAPDVVFNHTQAGEAGVYRTSISASNTEAYVSDFMIGDFSATGQYDETFVLGQTSNEVVLCIQVNADGTLDTIANTENPFIESSTGLTIGDFVLRQQSDQDEFVGYFYSSSGSRIIRTSTPPSLFDFDVSSTICSGSFTEFLTNISFLDAEEDGVTLDSISSTNQSILANGSIIILPNGDGTYNVQGDFLSGGTVTLVLWFSDDGVNPTSDVVTVDVTSSASPSFDAAEYSVCTNGNILDLDAIVDLPGGDFTIFNSLANTQDNTLDPSELVITASPTTFSLNYEYDNLNGCISSDEADLVVYRPAELSMFAQNSTCGGSTGNVEALVTDANGSYISYWNNGAQGVDQISNVPSGNYYITVIDDQGCIVTGQASVLSSDITVVETISAVSCQNGDDGEISLSITGAAGPFDVFWSNGMSTLTASGLVPGIYEAVITDDNGCQVTYSYALANPPKFEVAYNVVPPTQCNVSDGNISFLSANGTLPFDYEWSTSATTQNLVSTGEGIYFVEVTDANGCKYNEKFTLNSFGGPTYIDDDVTRSVCGSSTGSIELTLVPVTGEQITSIQWSNGMTTESIFNVPAGYYECIALQSDGCQSIFSWDLGVFPEEIPQICIVTVDSLTTTNLIVWEKAVTNEIDHYRIYRETSQAGSFMLIDTVHYASISVFNDVVASPKTKAWRYRISSVNQCGIESPPSTIHKTIHLVTNDIGGGEYQVTWDNYEGVSFSEYDVLRYTDQTGWVTILANVPFNALPFTTDIPPSTDGLDYMIEIDPGIQCTATFGKAQDYNSSRSNKARGEFNPGDGTGDPNNSIVEFEADAFSAIIYPNPTSGDFNIEVSMTAETNEAMFIKVVSMDGKIVHQGVINAGLNTVSLSNVQSGVYLVHLQKGSSTQVGRIIKQ